MQKRIEEAEQERINGVHGKLLRSEREQGGNERREARRCEFYHEHWMGLSLPMHHLSIETIRKGIKKAHVEIGSQQRVKRSLTWGMLAEMESNVRE